MSHSLEKQRAFGDVQERLEEFDRLKKEVRTKVCSQHKKKCKVEASWEEEYEVHVFIQGYCCLNFAGEIVTFFEAQKLFDEVIVELPKLFTEGRRALLDPLTVADYENLVKENAFAEFPLAISGGEKRMAWFVPIQYAGVDLHFHLCKVILKRCFSPTFGDLLFPKDFSWFITHFFAWYKEDYLRPALTPAIKEAATLLFDREAPSKGIIATTFLFGIIEYCVKYELGFRPDEFDFFDKAKKDYLRDEATGKQRPDPSLGTAIEALMEKDNEMGRAFKELDLHNVTYLNNKGVDQPKRWIYPLISKRLSLFRNTMLHGERYNFYSTGYYLLSLYALFQWHHQKSASNEN